MEDLKLLEELLSLDLVTPVVLSLKGNTDPVQISDLRQNARDLLVWARNIEKIAEFRLKVAVDNCPGHQFTGGHVCTICGHDSE